MTEKAFVKFLQWTSLYEKERPFQIFMDLLPGAPDQRKTNLLWDEREVEVKNLRDEATEFNLDTHGFATYRLPEFNDLMDRDTITEKYIPAVKNMLRSNVPDVGTVFVYDWRIRTSRPTVNEGKINFSDQTQPLLPSNYAHIDAGPTAIVNLIQQSFPKDAAKILRQRIRAVNVWKPLHNNVEEWPLAVCDGTTVKFEDLIETDSVRKGSISTNYYVKYSPEQTWYYLKEQTPEEALIFKHIDTEPGVHAPYAVHASIRQENVREDAVARHSIEVRTLVLSGVFEPDGVASDV